MIKGNIKSFKRGPGKKQNQKPKGNKNRRRNKPKNNQRPQRGPRPQRQNQTREITDVPLGNSQRQGFNRNSASKTVTKDEYIADIAGTVAFTTTQFAVQPGQAATFPWLAIEAKQWEKYEFQKLEFYLKPEVTQYTTNANSGKVILSFDSDASDPAPLNKQEAEDVMPMADGMSYQTVNLNIPKFILHSHHDSFYVRPGNLPGGADIKTYDLGNLFVSTVGQGGAVANMMELRVRYTCTLMIPILENTAAAPQNNQVSMFTGTTPNLVTTTLTTSLIGTVVSNGLNVVNTAGSLVPPPGNYIVSVQALFLDATPADMTLTKVIIEKNAGVLSFATFAGPPLQENNMFTEYFIQCNGTDALTFPVEATFTTGGVTATVYVILTAV